jgi:hypothetical protein
VFLVLAGIGLLAWIGYNLFVERLPETEGRSPWIPLVFGCALVGVGVARILGKRVRDS